VWWCVLARVVAFAAVVTKIREIVKVFLFKDETGLHCLPHGTESLAITAGIADGHQMLTLF
jgi:hypothetical protein